MKLTAQASITLSEQKTREGRYLKAANAAAATAAGADLREDINYHMDTLYDRWPIRKITFPTLKPWPRDGRRKPISLYYQNMVDGQSISALLAFDDVDESKRPTCQQLDIVASKYRRPTTVLKPDAQISPILWDNVVYALLIFNLMARPNGAGRLESRMPRCNISRRYAALNYFKEGIPR